MARSNAIKDVDFISPLAKKKVLVIGDLILDIHREGEKLGTSAETPTLVAKNKTRRISYGGAALFVRNILALGGRVCFLSLVGNDDLSIIAEQWSHPNLDLHYFKEFGRGTTAKERLWVDGYKLLQWDYLDNRPISTKTEKAILSFVKENLKSFDKITISDYRHGLLTPTLISALVSEAKKQKKPLYVDSQVSQSKTNHHWYSGANLICLNTKELVDINQGTIPPINQKTLEQLSRKLKIKNIVLKLGAEGSASWINEHYFKTSGIKVRTLDTTGAGDAFLAILALAPELSPSYLKLANLWAALSTTIKGPEPASLELLKKNLNKI
jgi:D-beta-D-heptose 7-phosphate kinase/D-beta-D-heptose 1-phosphate adenosyltransferase